jgi:hypothetical protein
MVTRFGSKIKMINPPDKEGWATFEYVEDGKQREWHVSEIRPESQEEYTMLFGETPWYVENE